LRHSPGDLLGRPSFREAVEDFLAKARFPFQFVRATTGMTPPHQLLRALWIVPPAQFLEVLLLRFNSRLMVEALLPSAAAMHRNDLPSTCKR
jgi:hypothetical protein